ncbi:MAG: N-acetyl-gamma-glutamyl-phosphate reductase [bacterium]
MIRVSVVGATGYTGGELIKILLKHPQVKLVHVTSESYAGKHISSVHQWLKGRCDMVCEPFKVTAVASDTDIAFLCLPHGASFLPAAELLSKGNKVIDLSADYRLKDAKLYKKWYSLNHPEPKLLKKAVYGLPELWHEKIQSAHLIANPGCYATACILALAPLMHKKIAKTQMVIADAKSGVSGAGKKLNLMYHYAEANENLTAYSVGSHRHMPEIEQELSFISGKKVLVSFTPHLIPMNRGILATCYVTLAKKIKQDDLITHFRDFYAKSPFVVVLPSGEYPETKNVSHTNFCHIGVHVDQEKKTAIIISAIDNLIKGASGQAVQNMNIMCGFNEAEGL